MSDHLAAAVRLVTEHGASPELGLVLGSGLGGFAQHLDQAQPLDYTEIPGMPVATVSGHAGKLWLGSIAGARVACLQGRVHLYEGQPPQAVVFGVRLLAALGARAVLLTNAAGGMAADHAPGDLMLITDHLNLTGQNPLVGPPIGPGPRFCDMTGAYDAALGALARRAANELGITLKQGVYAGVLGPSYETPAEIAMLQRLGAQAVGMSTVLETVALRQLGIRTAGISVITNLAAGLSSSELSHEDVKATAARSEHQVSQLLLRWCELILHAP